MLLAKLINIRGRDLRLRGAGRDLEKIIITVSRGSFRRREDRESEPRRPSHREHRCFLLRS